MATLLEKVKENCKEGIFAPYLKEYLDYLFQKGYSLFTICSGRQIILHFAKYLQRKKINSFSRISSHLLKQYLSLRKRKFRKRFKGPLQKPYQQIICWAIKGFLSYLNQQRGIELKEYFKEISLPTVIAPFFEDYLNFCRLYRGLKPITLKRHRRWLLRLGQYLETKEIRSFKSLMITDLDNFVLNYTSSLSRGSLQGMQEVLRSFLRYLFISGEMERDLSPHILSPKIYQNERIPKHISQDEIKLVLKQVDTHTALGKRDYAILVLLVSYGLRSNEISNLKIKDIDWKEKKIIFPLRKSGDALVLPLKEEVSQAILHYLRFSRQKKDYPQVFLTVSAPLRPITSEIVGTIAKKYIKKAGLNPASKGAHIFRHSLAKHLLEQGVSLATISKILGHKSIRSTMTYTRISTEQLREVSDNYANFL